MHWSATSNAWRERLPRWREKGPPVPRADGAVLASPATAAARVPVELLIVPERILYGLLAVIAVLLLGATLNTIASLAFGVELGQNTLRRHFDLNAENNIPTYFSALQLLTAAVLLGVIARHQTLLRSPWRRHFLILAVGFIFLSVDEAASIHETVLGRLGRSLLGDTFSFTWLGPGIVIVVLVALSYFRFLLALPRRVRRLFMASGVIFVAGAVGAEWIGSEIFRHWGFNWAHQTEVIVEEGLEMVGIALFIYALLVSIADAHIGLVVRVGRLRELPCPPFLTVAALLVVWPATHPIAEAQVQTDANLVTALDVSDSIMRHEEWLEIEGLAKAVVDASALDAIANGRYGRIGFAAFTWSSAGRFEVLVPWTLIASMDDAERVAATLRDFEIDRSAWQRPRNGSDGRGKTYEFQTDISGTIDFATALALTAPYAATRSVINVCANGADNVDEDPRAARDRALAAGIVLNGLAIGGEKSLASYFREHVQGGPGSFVIEVTKPEAVAAAMIDKLLRDLIAAPRSITTAVPFT